MCKTRWQGRHVRKFSSKFYVNCKGQLVGKQGQHWFLGLWARSGIQARSTYVPRLVKCNTAQVLVDASKVNIGSSVCEASTEVLLRAKSLGGSWWWSEDMAWELRCEVWKSSSGTMEESCVI